MRYLCTVSYDGYSYNGYQKQKHDKNTIQEVIENALSQIFKEEITIYGSGRTDKGVHALGQVFHFDGSSSIPVNNLKKAVNGLLPLDIRIKKVQIVDENFHARYSSHQKVYVYQIINNNESDIFNYRYYAFEREPLDIVAIRKAAKLLVGTHNYKNFTTNKIEEVESFEKTIYEVKVRHHKEKIEITFYGSGFLRYQIRMMVGALLVIGKHKKDSSYISYLLKDNVDEKCSFKADPQGLYLKEVIY